MSRPDKPDPTAASEAAVGVPGAALFGLGRVVVTATCLQAVARVNPGGEVGAQLVLAPLLARHARGEWGDVDPADARINWAAVKNGSRILSAYTVCGDVKVWIITDGESDACPACWTGEGTCEPDKGEWASGVHFRTDLPPRRLSTTILLPEDY